MLAPSRTPANLDGSTRTISGLTLHFSASLPKYSLQVSDRRVTRTRGLRLEEFDPDANKTLLYLASDAIVSMGYSGGAFVDGVHTDTWIAQTLTGVDSFVVGGVLAGFLARIVWSSPGFVDTVTTEAGELQSCRAAVEAARPEGHDRLPHGAASGAGHQPSSAVPRRRLRRDDHAGPRVCL